MDLFKSSLAVDVAVATLREWIKHHDFACAVNDPTVPARLLVDWLDGLPEPVVPREVTLDVAQVGAALAASVAAQAVEALSPAHRDTLGSVLGLCDTLLEPSNRSATGLTVEALGRVLAGPLTHHADAGEALAAFTGLAEAMCPNAAAYLETVRSRRPEPSPRPTAASAGAPVGETRRGTLPPIRKHDAKTAAIDPTGTLPARRQQQPMINGGESSPPPPPPTTRRPVAPARPKAPPRPSGPPVIPPNGDKVSSSGDGSDSG